MNNTDCVPYLEIETKVGILKFLVDSGSNKNYIRKELINPSNVKKSKSTEVTSVNGKFLVDSYINLKIFKESKAAKTSKFYLFTFHDFFDGLIGYECLQQAQACLDAPNNVLILPDLKIPLKRKFPQRASTHIRADDLNFISLATSKQNGDFLLEHDATLAPGVVVHSGLYTARNGRAIFAVSNYTNAELELPRQGLRINVNNFEAAPKDAISDVKVFLQSHLNAKHLNKEEKIILSKILLHFQDCFYEPGTDLSFTSAIKHRILTTDDVPVHAKTYRYPVKQREEVSRQIQKLLDQGIIRHSTSPYSAPIWVVPKKPDASGKAQWRLVVDYRKLNSKTIDDRYPMPNMIDVLDALGRCKYFTTLDFESGFNQIEIDPRDIEKTAFSVDRGKYEYLRMPFGLKGAPATFQRVMDNILRECIGLFALPYLDDIIIFSPSLQEHGKHVSKVLEILREHNLKIKSEKSQFFCKEVGFLGHIVTADGEIKMNPSKVQAVVEWPLPTNETELKGFLGTVGYYRRFIPKFAHISKPLTSQLKKGQMITHTKEFIESFELCKRTLISSQVLQMPDFSLPFNLTTDASNFAVGAVLSQGPIGKDRPVAFASRTLNKAECNYSTIEKEALAIVFAVKYFRPYLFGNKFQLYTDHKPLTYLFNIKDPSSRLVRWRLALEDYDYDIVYKPGRQNVVADGLSRIKIAEFNALTADSTFGPNASIRANVDESEQTVHSADSDGSDLIEMTFRPINSFARQIVLEVTESDNSKTEVIFPKVLRTTISRKSFEVRDIVEIFKEHLDFKKINCFYAPEHVFQKIQEAYKETFSGNKKIKIIFSQKMLLDVVSTEEQDEIIRETHERAHRGVLENLHAIALQYYFPRMKSKINTFVKLCTECKRGKYERRPHKIKFAETPLPKRPLDILHVDIFISGQYKFLSAVDKFSRFGFLVPIKSKSIPDVKKALIKIIERYGRPKMIVSDNEPALKSIEVRGFLEDLNIDTYFTPVNRSEVNGIVERFHSTIAEIFRCNRGKHPKWCAKTLFKLALELYNSSVHSAHKLTPKSVFLGIKDNEERKIDMQDILEKKEKFYDEVLLNLKQKRKNDLKINDKREDGPVFEKDEIVYLERQGIRNKTKDCFEPVKVAENKKETFIDDKGRKLHKANVRRKPK